MITALLIAQVAAAAPRPAARPVMASAFVEVLRAERVGALPSPDGLVRQLRRDDRGTLVEFD